MIVKMITQAQGSGPLPFDKRFLMLELAFAIGAVLLDQLLDIEAGGGLGVIDLDGGNQAPPSLESGLIILWFIVVIDAKHVVQAPGPVGVAHGFLVG